MPNIKAVQLGVRLRGKTIFENLNFKLGHGEGMSLHGPNGSGKTILLKTLAGLAKPSQGQIHMDRHFSRKRYVTYHSEMDLFLNVKEFLSCWGKAKEWAAQATFWGLEPLYRTPMGRLSMGELKRVHLATALSHPCDLLLLDEPDVGLDQTYIDLLFQALAQKRKNGTAVVISSHHEDLFANDLWQKLHLEAKS